MRGYERQGATGPFVELPRLQKDPARVAGHAVDLAGAPYARHATALPARRHTGRRRSARGVRRRASHDQAHRAGGGVEGARVERTVRGGRRVRLLEPVVARTCPDATAVTFLADARGA